MPNETDQEAMQANLENENPEQQRGRASAFACPECHGVLWELEENSMLRFRCRVGHAFTAAALGVAMSESSEEALWAAMRALEEKAALLRRLALRSPGRLAENYEQEAAGYDMHADSIRKILLENQVIESEAAKQRELVPPDAA